MMVSVAPNRKRLRQVLLVVGIVAVATFWYARNQFLVNNSDKDATGFDSVSDDAEEDFVSSMRTAITTVQLPEKILFDKPQMDSNKPNLILHVGPVKAGVEQLAREIMQAQPLLKEALQNDNYVVVFPSTSVESDDAAQVETPYKSPIDTSALHYACQNELNEVRIQWKLSKHDRKHTLEEYIERVPCWSKFLSQLQTFQNTNTNVVIADEQLSSKVILEAEAVNGEPAILDWLTLRDTIMKDWNVIVVITYRRYYQWLLAAKARAEQLHLEQHSAQLPRLARWPGYENGMLLEPLFPHFVQDAVQKLDVPYTYRIQQLYQPFVVDVRLINIHDDWSSMVPSFLCDVLPSATNACATSQQLMDTNKLATNDQLLGVDADLKWYDWQLYDELVNEAAHRMFLRWKHCTRTAATITTEYYVKTHLGKSARDLPLQCPGQAAAQRFLDESLQYEQHLLPASFATAERSGHSKEFWDWARSSKQICSINMGQVLHRAEWRSFFRHLTNQSADKIRSGERKPGTPKMLRG